MTRDELLALADRCENADASEQRELLNEVAAAIWGPEVREVVICDPDLFDKLGKFDDLLDALAYVSAALMLVPEGFRLPARAILISCIAGHVPCVYGPRAAAMGR